jgi:glucose/arabinose dehydrogenase
VTRRLDAPWGLAFLPGGAVLVGERDRAQIVLVHLDGSKRLVKQVRGVRPNGDEGGEAGLLGLTLSPSFRADHQVYAYLSSGHDNRVVRMTWHHHRLGPKHVVFRGIPRALHHNGGRIAFGPDRMLYVTTGEAEVPSRAQNRRSLGGKILRMTPRGRPAPGNPFAHSVVYSYGHRNVEGLAWDSAGRLWATEFGEHAYDELNLIRPGRNYGWPIVEGRSSDRRFTNPKAVWLTDHAGPSGITITRVQGRTVAYIGALTGHRIWRVVLHGHRVASKRALYTGAYGRIRTTAAARGYLWFTTSNTDGRATPRPGDDKLLRLKLR